ncbi:hypothetical protein LX32DRAFT_92009 [Colletotrichum zoysiae]|uniref:Uncharacterized protein n=1 Tax=Colletotrichum zoysiae TaxID=1216348 RepID=A0AAD9HB06_9PEZI|nr:hypothetical protein LX32DRAFT_92009 [Colletotrichum zoysiae]
MEMSFCHPCRPNTYCPHYFFSLYFIRSSAIAEVIVCVFCVGVVGETSQLIWQPRVRETCYATRDSVPSEVLTLKRHVPETPRFRQGAMAFGQLLILLLIRAMVNPAHPKGCVDVPLGAIWDMPGLPCPSSVPPGTGCLPGFRASFGTRHGFSNERTGRRAQEVSPKHSRPLFVSWTASEMLPGLRHESLRPPLPQPAGHRAKPGQAEPSFQLRVRFHPFSPSAYGGVNRFTGGLGETKVQFARRLVPLFGLNTGHNTRSATVELLPFKP